jgi:hypothetical protein
MRSLSMKTPTLHEALEAATFAVERAYAACDACSCTCRCANRETIAAAVLAEDAARTALRESAEPRDWLVRMEGPTVTTVQAPLRAGSAEDALIEACTNPDYWINKEIERTSVVVTVRCDLTDEWAACGFRTPPRR